MKNYYSKSLNSNNLQKCYDIAPPRVKQFLEAEINFVLSKIKPSDKVLDLGCGYGRVMKKLSEKAKTVTGIDISNDNIDSAKKIFDKIKNCEFYTMDAGNLTFPDEIFDLTICIQNGISAFKLDPSELITESIRVTKKGGNILFSTYSDMFWKNRLEWFKIQAEFGLIGEIDNELTGNGVIVCKDGFKATTFSKQEFNSLASHFPVKTSIYEVDSSIVFCEMIKI